MDTDTVRDPGAKEGAKHQSMQGSSSLLGVVITASLIGPCWSWAIPGRPKTGLLQASDGHQTLEDSWRPKEYMRFDHMGTVSCSQ